MTNPLKESIDKRLGEERYQLPKRKRKTVQFSFQLFLILSILLGLLFSLFRVITYFF